MCNLWQLVASRPSPTNQFRLKLPTSIQSMSKALEIHGFLLVDILISLVHGGSICFIAKRADSNPTVMDHYIRILEEMLVLKNSMFQSYVAEKKSPKTKDEDDSKKTDPKRTDYPPLPDSSSEDEEDYDL